MTPDIFRWHGRKKAFRTLVSTTVFGLTAGFLAACSSASEDDGIATAQFQGSAANQELLLIDGPDSRAFVGAVVADEPRAALAARFVLENGGTAVDAATALYFNLAVTMPHAAGLGGGGLCLVHDPEAREVTSYNFLARRSRAGGPIAVPGNVRGFALMQATHGTSPWSSLVAPAEVLAAQGHEVSRALVRELVPLTAAIRTRPQLAEVYLRPGGQPLRQGDLLVQQSLAAALGRIRASGPSGFYSGAIAEAYASKAAQLGSAITIDELRAYRPVVVPAQTFKIGDQTLSLPSADTGAGMYLASIWPAAQQTDGIALLQAAQAALVDAGAETTLPSDFGSTAFAVATAGGDAVACAVTMNGPFGTGAIVEGTGVIPARAPDAPGFGLAGAFLAPAIVANDFNGSFFYAGAAAGGPSGSAAVLDAAQAIVGASATIESAHAASVADADSLMNIIACPGGAPREGAVCSFGADPKGAGLGAVGFPPSL